MSQPLSPPLNQPGITRIGWCTVTDHCSDLLFEPPEPVRPTIPCPAISGWLAQTFLVRAPYDVHLALERTAGGAALRWLDGAPGNDVYESFAVAAPSLWPARETPIVMWDLRNLFVADRPTVAETVAPFLHAGATQDPGQQWPGVMVPQRLRLDLAARPLNWPLLWLDTTRPLRIRRGDPLQYVRFHGDAFETAYRLETIPYTAALAEVVAGHGSPSAALLPARAAVPAAAQVAAAAVVEPGSD